MRKPTYLAVLAAFLLAGSSALAAPVAPRRAAHQIMRHFWEGAPGAARVSWCREEHFGTLCALRDHFSSADGGVTGRETKILWVSERHRRTTVRFLGSYIVLRISG